MKKLIVLIALLASGVVHADVVATLEVQGGVHYFTSAPCGDEKNLYASFFQTKQNTLWNGCWTYYTQIGQIVVAYPDKLEDAAIYDMEYEVKAGNMIFLGEGK